jgi:hypothetical protein
LPPTPDFRPPRARSPWTGLAGGVALLFCLDALLFRTGLYPSILEPESTSGKVEYTLALEASRPKTAPRQVLVFGDSRMRFLAKVANREARGRGLEFGNSVVQGSTPRSWYYMLRAEDPQARAYAAVVLPLDSYDDIDGRDDLADIPVDLHHVVGLVGLADVPEFAFSYRGWGSRWQALRGALLKGVVYQADIRAFLSHPAARLEKVRAYEEYYMLWAANYNGEEGTLAGLSVDWNARRIVFPERLTAEARNNLADVLLRAPEPQTGRTAAYRRKWFAKVVERYRGTPTRVAFLRLPRGPVPPPPVAAQPHSVVRELARRNPHVVLLDERLFDSLERPELYADGLHLNAAGSRLLSAILAEELRQRLEAPPDAL